MNDTATSPSRPRLERRPDDRVVAGVASGIADHFGIDVTIVRVAFVVAAVLGGFGVLAYLGAWLFLPTPDAERPGTRNWRFWVGLALLVAAFATVLGRFDLPDSGWVFAILLIGVGVALWRQPVAPDLRRWGPRPRPTGGPTTDPDGGGSGGGPGGGGDGPTSPTAPTAPTDWAEPSVAPAVDVDVDVDALTEPGASPGVALVPLRYGPPASPTSAAPPRPSAPPRPPSRAEVRAARPRSWLTAATLAAAFIATGVTIGLDRADVIDVSSAKAAAVALTVLGAGLVVGAFAGRARALIIPAVLLVPVVATLGTLDHLGLDPFDGMGQRTYRVESLSDPDLRPEYHLGTGELRLDLSRLDPAGTTVAVQADVAVGSLRVWVPAGVEVAVRGEVAAGDLDVAGEQHDGRDVDERIVIPGDAGRGRIDLDLQVGFGAVRVSTDSPDRELGRPTIPRVPATPVVPVAPATPTVPSVPVTPTVPSVPVTTTATPAATVPTTVAEGTR